MLGAVYIFKSKKDIVIKAQKTKRHRRIFCQLKNYSNQTPLPASIVSIPCQNRDHVFIIVWQSFDNLCTLVVAILSS